MDKKEIEKEFSRIYYQYISPIYRFFYLKSDSQEIAEDLTQETFFRLWKALNSNEKIKNPRAYLYRLARNLITDFYRKEKKKQEIPLDSSPEIIDSADFQKKIIINAEIEQIKKNLQDLKEEYQLVIIWHYLEDVPIKEIAEILNKSEENIRVLLHRALKSLREKFK
jgi:RNA polymerase sigma-70 factor (ECF subfamily)